MANLSLKCISSFQNDWGFFRSSFRDVRHGPGEASEDEVDPDSGYQTNCFGDQLGASSRAPEEAHSLSAPGQMCGDRAHSWRASFLGLRPSNRLSWRKKIPSKVPTAGLLSGSRRKKTVAVIETHFSFHPWSIQNADREIFAGES